MGAVNYFTSDYITMGLRPYDSWELENDSDFMKEMRDELRTIPTWAQYNRAC